MKTTFCAATALAMLATPANAQRTRSISAGDKAQGAKANPDLLAQFGGAYDGPQVAYVRRVGQGIAVQSGLSKAQGDSPSHCSIRRSRMPSPSPAAMSMSHVSC